jgi:hypothetical protein
MRRIEATFSNGITVERTTSSAKLSHAWRLHWRGANSLGTKIGFAAGQDAAHRAASAWLPVKHRAKLDVYSVEVVEVK